ncbi:MAG: type II toxin-antitoxin system VapC family toxin [Terriglobales bacterium]
MSGRLIALDTNLLVYAYDRDSPWHARAADCLSELAEATATWAIPWPCVHEFLAVTTNPRLVRRAGSLERALQQVEFWMESPSLEMLGELQGHWRELKSVLAKGRLLGGQVHDARIAALCLEHGVTELWSADRDFSRIAGLRVRNPLLT